MKKRSCIILILLLLLGGCSANRTDITPEEIIAAYEKAGYIVSSGTYEETVDNGETGYIKAEDSSGEYIYFSIFESDASAQAYKDSADHPGMNGLLSVIFGDPQWHRYEICGCIVAEYSNREFFDIFEELQKEK